MLSIHKEPTKPFWLNKAPYQDIRSASELPEKTQVVVIGGGLTGISCTYHLSKMGIEVVLFERRGLSGGATGRNAGALTPGTIRSLVNITKEHGIETALAIWNYTKKIVETIKEFVKMHNVDCDLRFGGNVTLAINSEEAKSLEDGAKAAAKYGLPGVYWDKDICIIKTHSKSFQGGLFRPTGGQFWPAKLVFALAKQAIALGAIIQTRTDVIAVEGKKNNFNVRTNRGNIKANIIVNATNAWAQELLPFAKDKIVPARGHVIITQPLPKLWDFTCITSNGNEYWLQRPDGCIVLGGMSWVSPATETNTYDDTSLNPLISQRLREFLPYHFPMLRDIKVKQEWSGIMGDTPDGFPLIGPVPELPGQFIAAGYSGYGMPMTFAAGKSIAEMINGQKPEGFVEKFLPSRFAK